MVFQAFLAFSVQQVYFIFHPDDGHKMQEKATKLQV